VISDFGGGFYVLKTADDGKYGKQASTKNCY